MVKRWLCFLGKCLSSWQPWRHSFLTVACHTLMPRLPKAWKENSISLVSFLQNTNESKWNSHLSQLVLHVMLSWEMLSTCMISPLRTLPIVSTSTEWVFFCHILSPQGTECFAVIHGWVLSHDLNSSFLVFLYYVTVLWNAFVHFLSSFPSFEICHK